MYTHNFEMIINGIDISGELSFNGGEDPAVSISGGVEMSMDDMNLITNYFKITSNLCNKCGEIEKIRFIKKP